jgi:hypothetical protein
MTDLVLCWAEAGSQKPQDGTEPDAARLMLHALIDALVDLDLAFERECKELSKSRLDAPARVRNAMATW